MSDTDFEYPPGWNAEEDGSVLDCDLSLFATQGHEPDVNAVSNDTTAQSHQSPVVDATITNTDATQLQVYASQRKANNDGLAKVLDKKINTKASEEEAIGKYLTKEQTAVILDNESAYDNPIQSGSFENTSSYDSSPEPEADGSIIKEADITSNNEEATKDQEEINKLQGCVSKEKADHDGLSNKIQALDDEVKVINESEEKTKDEYEAVNAERDNVELQTSPTAGTEEQAKIYKLESLKSEQEEESNCNEEKLGNLETEQIKEQDEKLAVINSAPKNPSKSSDIEAGSHKKRRARPSVELDLGQDFAANAEEGDDLEAPDEAEEDDGNDAENETSQSQSITASETIVMDNGLSHTAPTPATAPMTLNSASNSLHFRHLLQTMKDAKYTGMFGLFIPAITSVYALSDAVFKECTNASINAAYGIAGLSGLAICGMIYMHYRDAKQYPLCRAVCDVGAAAIESGLLAAQPHACKWSQEPAQVYKILVLAISIVLFVFEFVCYMYR